MTYLDSPPHPSLVNIARYELGDVLDWTSPVLIQVYDHDRPFTSEELEVWENDKPLLGYVFVCGLKIKAGRKNLWKMPAGHRKKESEESGWDYDRNPLDTAKHESKSETGIPIPPVAFSYVDKYLHWSKSHWKCLFIARITRADLKWMNEHHPENEGVAPKFFTIDGFYDLVRQGEFLREHFEKLVEYGLVLPLKYHDTQMV